MRDEDGSAELQNVWRRVHRPEEYAADVARFLAAELKIPFFAIRPVIPLAGMLLRKWDDAAVETTALYELPSGERILRTFFEITDYSSDVVYGTMEKILKKLGVGTSLSEKYGTTDFTWILLGGVLNDYAMCAGICKNSCKKLLDFRFPLSDYFTATTWYPSFVEIANLKTGRIETLELSPVEIRKIVDWSLGFEKKNCASSTLPVGEHGTNCPEFMELDRLYKKIKSENS